MVYSLGSMCGCHDSIRMFRALEMGSDIRILHVVWKRVVQSIKRGTSLVPLFFLSTISPKSNSRKNMIL